MRFEITRRSVLISLASASGAFSKPFSKSWEEPVFPNWTNDFVDRMLTDSPWAKQATIGFQLQPEHQESRSNFLDTGGINLPGRTREPEPPSRGGGARAEIYLTIRWASALPIRQATALQDYTPQGLDTPEAVELLNRNDSEYVIEIAGFPTSLFRKGAKPLEDSLAKSASLYVSGRPPVSPTSVRVPDFGMHLMATLRFPRFKDLTPADGAIELSAATGSIKINQSFKLKPMVYRSRLEL